MSAMLSESLKAFSGERALFLSEISPVRIRLSNDCWSLFMAVK